MDDTTDDNSNLKNEEEISENLRSTNPISSEPEEIQNRNNSNQIENIKESIKILKIDNVSFNDKIAQNFADNDINEDVDTDNLINSNYMETSTTNQIFVPIE